MQTPPQVAPLDEHNSTLIRNVRPPDGRRPAQAGRYNLVVIGAVAWSVVRTNGVGRGPGRGGAVGWGAT